MNLISQEQKKRQREKRVALFVSLLFLVTTFWQAYLRRDSGGHGFLEAILYFGLLHLNVIIICLLVFLLSRNIVKAYLSRRSGVLGANLRWKMVTSLVAFSLLPSLLLFVGSTFVIRQGFDQWFGGQMTSALEDSESLVETHYQESKAQLVLLAEHIKSHQSEVGKEDDSFVKLDALVDSFPIDAILLFNHSLDRPFERLKKESFSLSGLPELPLEFFEKLKKGGEFFERQRFPEGDFLTYLTTIHWSQNKYNLVLIKVIPSALKSKMEDLKSSLAGFRQTQTLKSSIKTHYSLLILTLFALTLFVVSWFGLYLTRQITDPVSDLVEATESFRKGDWNYRIKGVHLGARTPKKGKIQDLELLKSAFNLMAEEVGNRGKKLERANFRLTSLVDDLENREKYLETLLLSIRRGVVVLGSDKKISRINKEAIAYSSERFHEAASEQLIGRDWDDVFSSLFSGGRENWLEQLRLYRGQSAERIFELVHEIGGQSSYLSVKATGIALMNDDQENIGWLVILEDVSQTARLEKMAAWQEVARRVAHEIKNPLTPIQLSSDIIRRKLVREKLDDEVVTDCVNQIQKQVRVIRDLVREFSQFAKLPEPTFAEICINQSLREIFEDYRLTNTKIDFLFQEEKLAGKDVWLWADSEYIRRVMVNLLDNAIQSLEESQADDPKIEISLESKDEDAKDLFVVRVSDNGPGIAPEMRARIFDPYVSAKAKGTGLGLAIVQRIVMEHRGRIYCEESSQGACFVIELPMLKKDMYGPKNTHS